MNYTTQMDAAKKGIITDEMKIVAKKESIQINQLIDLMAIGQVVIPANKNHKNKGKCKFRHIKRLYEYRERN